MVGGRAGTAIQPYSCACCFSPPYDFPPWECHSPRSGKSEGLVPSSDNKGYTGKSSQVARKGHRIVTEGAPNRYMYRSLVRGPE